MEDANFYSNDTDASLIFIPHEDTFDFQSAKVVMYNRGDESLVERDMEVTTEDGRKVASYEMPDEIISHWGEWTAQPVFISGGEIYSGSIVPFSVFRYLMHERPPKLNEIVSVTNFIQQSQALVDDMAQEEAQRVTQEQARQIAEQERVQGYQEIQQIIEDGVLNAEPKDGSVTTEKLSDKAVEYEKLSSEIQEDLFVRVENLAPKLSYENYKTTAFELIDNGDHLVVESGSRAPYARVQAPLSGDFQPNDMLFIRVEVKPLDVTATNLRILLRNGTTGSIIDTRILDIEVGKREIHYYTHKLTQTPENLMLILDTQYPNSVVGRQSEIYDISVYKIDETIENLDEFNKMSYKTNNLFNAKNVLGRISKLEEVGGWQVDDNVSTASLEIYHEPDGSKTSRAIDKFKYPNTLYWGNEYLYSWYRALEDNKDLTMIWSGDSTTYNTNNPTGYKRHELGQQLMTKSGYNNVTSINAGHGENTTRNWRDTWSDEDLVSIGNAITDNRLPIYILGWGINDGGLNYNAGTSIQERVDRFETALFEGLTKVRAMYTAEQLPIILATPVTTHDLTNKRNNDEWQNHIRYIIQRAARQFQCAFIDIGLYHYDRTYADYWSTGGDKVHPNMYSTKDYMSLFKNLLVPELFERQTMKPNLLPNGDFQGTIGSSTVAGWSSGTMGTGGIIQLTESPWGTQGVNALKIEVADQRAYLSSSTKYPITGGKIYTLSCVANGDAPEVWYEFSNAQGERILHETNRKFTDVGNSRYTITLLSPNEATDISINRIGIGVTSNSTGSVIFERLRLDLGELV